MSRSRSPIRILSLSVALLGSCWSLVGLTQSLTVDHAQVKQWNRFADALYTLHERQLQEHKIVTSESMGGYANNPDYYREVSYHDAESGQLLSRIRWVTQQPDVVHSIDVFQYDEQGRLDKDFAVVYLPMHRNAPIQTLINIHQYHDDLMSFRQFDASGVRIYEQCRGHYASEPVMISLDQDELPLHTGHLPQFVTEELYTRCFANMPEDAAAQLSDLLPELSATTEAFEAESYAKLVSNIDLLSELIAIAPDKAQWYLDRGRGYFKLQDVERAINDFSGVGAVSLSSRPKI